ncbi:hypothetical protein [Treponema berlinense]|uniref:hypothetical protein n=1 Tax=Treponema berlinense TaxID=225004 RepID=UPI0026EA54B9|nr:hypothetical protein [Treponema berlinense]
MTEVLVPQTVKNHRWYFFTEDGFSSTDLPQKSGISTLKPWTESLRAGEAGTALDGSGYMAVNRLGVIHFALGEDGQIEPFLLQDYEIFSNSTVSTLFFEGNNPYLTLVRSSFFNKDASLSDNPQKQDSNRPFLVRISPEFKAFYPAITYGDLNLAEGGEITGTFFDGTTFVSSIKKLKNSKTEFSYISFTANGSLESLVPYTQDTKVNVEETSEENYRLLNSPKNFDLAPKRLQKLLASIPGNFSFSVECRSLGEPSSRIFISATRGQAEDSLAKAQAQISDGWCCAVFPDGTTYFNGALEGLPILNSGKNIAFRLPKLPEDYVYSVFCIAGTTLAVAWEESDFYKTGRSGFLTVDLKKVLYD